MKFSAIVVGAGPAGVSCSLWLKQLGFTPVLVDKQDKCGGLQLANPYTNTWIASTANAWGRDVAMAMHDNMLSHKIEMRLGNAANSASLLDDGVAVQLSDGETLTAQVLVLAGGVTPKTGGFASRVGMMIGAGVAVANAKFDGASVAILGGGDNAFESYLVAKERGAKSVVIFARSIKARLEMLERVPPEDVVIGEYQVDAVSSKVNDISFDHIQVLYGYEVNKSSLLGLELAMRPDGFVSTNEDCITSKSRVYAIGELACRAHPCCVTAMADGVVAAKAIQRRLEASASARYGGLARRAISLGAKVFK